MVWKGLLASQSSEVSGARRIVGQLRFASGPESIVSLNHGTDVLLSQ